MTIDERDRNDLYNRLAEVLGPDPARTLMSYLPPVGWADVATKVDLASLGRELNAEISAMDSRFSARLHEALNAQTRSLYVGLSGILAAYSLLIVGALNFVR